jgi:hypothetical protein
MAGIPACLEQVVIRQHASNNGIHPTANSAAPTFTQAMRRTIHFTGLTGSDNENGREKTSFSREPHKALPA